MVGFSIERFSNVEDGRNLHKARDQDFSYEATVVHRMERDHDRDYDHCHRAHRTHCDEVVDLAGQNHRLRSEHGVEDNLREGHEVRHAEEIVRNDRDRGHSSRGADYACGNHHGQDSGNHHVEVAGRNRSHQVLDCTHHLADMGRGIETYVGHGRSAHLVDRKCSVQPVP